MLCNSTETQTKPTINRGKKNQHLTPGFNQVTPSITDFQETHECAHTHVRAHNTHQKISKMATNTIRISKIRL